MSNVQERTLSVKFTPEMRDVYGVEEGDFESTLEEKAKRLENSIAGIVIVERERGSKYHTVRVIHKRSAEQDIIKQQLQAFQSEIMRSIHDNTEYWTDE